MIKKNTVWWKLHLNSPPDKVYELLTTSSGREKFWAEKSQERDNYIYFEFSNGMKLKSRILESKPSKLFKINYFGDSITTFRLQPDEIIGTELHLEDEMIPLEDITEVNAGWVNVLLTLKAAVDFDVDLRNQFNNKNWANGYVDV